MFRLFIVVLFLFSLVSININAGYEMETVKPGYEEKPLDATVPEQMTEPSPDNASAQGLRVSTCVPPQEWDKAISELKKAIELDPNNTNLYSMIGNAYFFKGDYNEAMKVCKGLINFEPQKGIDFDKEAWMRNKAVAHHLLGTIYDKVLGDHEKATEEYNKANEAKKTASWHSKETRYPRSDYLKSYKILVETGTVKGAGTDANVEIKLIGNKGETAMHIINNPGYNDFKRASTDTFSFNDGDVGMLSAIVVKHDNARGNAKWYLVKVTAYPPDGKRYVFTYNNWIPDADGKLEVRIQEDSFHSPAGGSVIVPKPQ